MPNMTPVYKGYRIYPRGFLGANLGAAPKEVLQPHEVRVKTHQYSPDMFKPEEITVEFNHNVEKLWAHLLRTNRVMLDFDYREQLLKIAFEAFGTQDFMAWVNLQFEGPTTGGLHAKFIEDTLNFILTGRRELTLTNWEPMLTSADLTSNTTKITDKAKEFFKRSRGTDCPSMFNEKETFINVNLIDVIQRWCSQEGGFEDLVQTLHVLFGDIVS